MIYIDRPKEAPEFWREFCDKNKIVYDELENTEAGRNIRHKLRDYNIEQQHGLCAYCCRKISIDNSLNEHIKPRGCSEYSKFSMDYDNIVSCCDKREDDSTCSHHKGNEYDERLFVSPLNEECESHFQYAPNGQVFSSSKEGQYTIDLLNLNSYKLQRARAAHIKNCKAYTIILSL